MTSTRSRGSSPPPVFRLKAASAALGRYGAGSTRLIEVASGNSELLSTLSDGQTTMAEVVHAVRFESAATVADFTLRRTRLAWLTTDHGRKDQEVIATLMGNELDWSSEKRPGKFKPTSPS